MFTTKFINLLKVAFARNAVICFAIFQLDNRIPNVFNIPPLLLKAPDTLPITLTKTLRNLLIGERIAFFKVSYYNVLPKVLKEKNFTN